MSLHTVSVLVEDQPGVLTQVSGWCPRRGFNIHSLAVGTTERTGMSRMTIVVEVTAKPLEQVTKQLNKLVSVIKVTELEPDASVERELALIKVHTKPEERFQVLELAEIFRARVIDVARSTVTTEVSGPGGRGTRSASCSSRTDWWRWPAPVASRWRGEKPASEIACVR